MSATIKVEKTKALSKLCTSAPPPSFVMRNEPSTALVTLCNDYNAVSIHREGAIVRQISTRVTWPQP